MKIFLLLLARVFSVAAAATNASDPTPVTCPMDLRYVLTVPWNRSGCEAPKKKSSSSSPASETAQNNTLCCQTLMSLYGIALSRRLKETSLFQLPDVNTSVACLDDLQSKLASLSLPAGLASSCFVPEEFVLADTPCAGLSSTGDWKARLGNSTQLDSSCSPDLTYLSDCDACVAAGLKVQAKLIELDELDGVAGQSYQPV